MYICILIAGLSGAQQDSLVIVYSHNTNGVLENCNCPERSYGALEKRAVVIDSIRDVEKNILLVDSGDILDIQPSKLLHSYIVRAYDYIKYDYWTPGDQDFVEGTDFFLNKLSAFSAILINTNIYYKQSLVGQPYAIKEFGKFRIGITGTIRDDLHKYLDPETGSDFRFNDQFANLDPVIKNLSENLTLPVDNPQNLDGSSFISKSPFNQTYWNFFI